MERQQETARPRASFAARHFMWWAWLWPVAWFGALLLIRDRSPQFLAEFESFLGFAVLLVSGVAFPFLAYFAREAARPRQPGDSPEAPPNRLLLLLVGGITVVFAVGVASWLLRGAPRHVPADPGEFDYTHVRSIRGE